MRQTRIGRAGPLLLVLAVLLGGGLAACGPMPAPTATPAGPTPTVTVPIPLPVVVSLAGRFDENELAALDPLVVDFEDANPDIKVEIAAIRGDAAQRREIVFRELGDPATGSDIYALDDAWLAELTAGDRLALLDDYVEPWDVRVADFLPPALDACTVAGRLVALPWTVDGGLLYYRSDVLAEHGQAPPRTWAELQQMALELQRLEGLPHGYVWQGAAYESLTHNALEHLRAAGGEVLDASGRPTMDDVHAQAALAQMLALVQSGVSPEDIATYTEGDAFAAFDQGAALFMRHWSGAWQILHREESSVAGRVGVAPLPAASLFVRALVLSPHSMYPDEAFRFMVYLVEHEQQVEWAKETSQPPALETTYADDELLAARPVFASLHAALRAAEPRPRTVAYPAVSEAIYSGVNEMLRGQQDAAETAAAIQRRLEEILEPNSTE